MPSSRPASTMSPVALRAIDWVFFVFAGLAAVWMAWMFVRQSFAFGWWQLLFLVVFWVALAYLVLPRLHRILTAIYVPDYFIGRARTSDGLLGDPVNLALHGTEAQVHRAMRDAGWVRADDLSFTSGLRIVTSTLGRRSYERAPVSPLLLFGRPQDFAYQQEVDGSPGRRHHVRFWRCPDGWRLPGGHAADWLAAGTYDRSVGLSLYTLQITHRIADDIDAERDFIVRTVLESNPAVSVEVIEDFSTGYHARNGGGDTIETDGDLPVLDVRRVDAVADERAAAPTDSRDRRPAAITVGALLVALGALMSLVTGVMQLLDAQREASSLGLSPDEGQLVAGLLAAFAAFTIAVAIAQSLLALAVYRGSNRARMLVMVLGALLMVSLIVGSELGDTASIVDNLPGVALNVLVLLTLSSHPATTYARRRRAGRAPVAAT